jgi:flagellar P-ring protein precursor FlgI
MKRAGAALLLCLAALFLAASATPSRAERIKDLAAFEGVRENMLMGYGLVVGLDGAGDNKGPAVQSTINMLQRMGLVVDEGDIKSKNTAAVIVTGSLPPFPKPGTHIDVTVSAMGDAKTLQGGMLLMTPMKAADGRVYAIAQGPVSVGGFVGGGGGNKVVKNHPTVGTISGGAIVERDLPFTLGKGDSLRLFLHRQDFTNATRIAAKINEELKSDRAVAVDPSTVRIAVPEEYKERLPELISALEAFQVSIDLPARVTVNERTGTVVIGENVRISPVAIAHGNLTIEIKTDLQVSQPASFGPKGSETVVVPQTQVTANEGQASLMEVSGASLGEIVRALNSLGVSPRDLIAILQALRTSGALRAELEVL